MEGKIAFATNRIIGNRTLSEANSDSQLKCARQLHVNFRVSSH